MRRPVIADDDVVGDESVALEVDRRRAARRLLS